jgi:hypothetical protein
MRLASELLPAGRLGLAAAEILEAARLAGLGAADLGAVMEIVAGNQRTEAS